VDERAELEAQLLRDPDDDAARARYARFLESAGAWQDALAQWSILVRRRCEAAAPHLGAARCCRALGDVERAGVHLASARACADFDAAGDGADAPDATRHARVSLRAIPGARAPERVADVIPIAPPSVVRFRDVVGMEDLKQIIRLRIIEPFLRPGLFQRFQRKAGGGVLLYGPPGCGKTLIARAVAHECKAAFTPIGISEILNLWVGQSERNLAAVFDKARSEAPAVLFFDELDALAFSRSKANADHTRTLVNEFLSQLDGLAGRNDKILVLAATNRPWDVDEAMKRPGRFDRPIFVPPPDAAARAEMLRAKLATVPSDAIDVQAIASLCPHFSGADVDGLIDRAKDGVLAEILETGVERNLREDDLRAAAATIEPSTLEWLQSARNLVKFGGATKAYKDVEAYLRSSNLY